MGADVANDGREWAELPEGGPVPGSRAHEAYLEVRRRIVRLEMAPDQQFTEGSLAAELAMSKTPVREALGVLSFDGYVAVIPHSGYRVATITLRDINDQFAIHIPLARAALQSSIFWPEHLETLAGLLTARNDSETDQFLENYMRFQVLLASRAANRRLQPLLARMLHQHERLVRLGIQKGAAPRDLVGDDAPTLAALREADVDAAADEVAARLHRCRDTLLRGLVAVDDILDAAIRG